MNNGDDIDIALRVGWEMSGCNWSITCMQMMHTSHHIALRRHSGGRPFSASCCGQYAERKYTHVTTSGMVCETKIQ